MTRTEQLLEASRELFNELPRAIQQKHFFKIGKMSERFAINERVADRLAKHEARVNYALASPLARYVVSLLSLAEVA